MWWKKTDLYIGKVMDHNGRFKQVINVTDEYIETKYVVPNKNGWHKVEKLYIRDLVPPSVEELNIIAKQQLNKYYELQQMASLVHPIMYMDAH
jgi:hypothetical protein